MSFLTALETEASYARTMNGAKTYNTSSDACLDLFALAGGMRYRSRSAQIGLFDRAYIENPDLAMKLLFHIRDIRGGMGERSLFRTLLRHTAFTWPGSVLRNAAYISKFGRWDDLLCLIGTPAEEEAVRIIGAQLALDREALKKGPAAHVSLLAKWLPSDNASSPRTRKQALVLCRALGMDRRKYRSILTRLRSRISLTETLLTQKKTSQICYESVPAGAMLKYRRVFEKRDPIRFCTYLRDAAGDSCRIHADTLFPYEILRPYFNEQEYGRSLPEGSRTLEVLWKKLPGSIGNADGISVVDTSGSMYWKQGPLTPALVSQAMGIYCAERCQGIFHNRLITFESRPHLVELKGNTMADRLRYLRSLPWGGSTDLEAVFDLILDAAVKSRAPQSEMPQVIYIFSDMEFNSCIRGGDRTVYENARARFEAAGYRMPAVVFHNVNSWQTQVPVRAHTRGSALTSGASVHGLSAKFDGNITPMDHMLRILESPRYAMIRA